jgi:hypothetical protein
MSWRVATKVGLLAGAMFLAACGGNDPDPTPDGGTNPSGEERPGMGESTKAPVGAAFALPAGLAWASPTVKAYNEGYKEDCDDKEEKDGKGSGDLVRLCLALRNTTGQPILVTLPAGIIFVSEKDDTQNGILVQTVSFEVPPMQVFYAPLFLYCLNQGRTPSLPKDEFHQGPVTQYQDFQELFSLVSSKTLQPSGQIDLQHAVWHLSLGQGLSKEDRTAISKL